MKQTATSHTLVISPVLCPLKQRTPVRNVSTDKAIDMTIPLFQSFCCLFHLLLFSKCIEFPAK